MTKPRTLGVNQRSGPADDIIITVYVCKNFKNCGGYYASSSSLSASKRHICSCGSERVQRYARIVSQSEVSEIEKRERSRLKASKS